MHFQGMMVRSDYVLMHAFNCSFFCKVVFMMALQCLLFNGVASYCMLLHGHSTADRRRLRLPAAAEGVASGGVENFHHFKHLPPPPAYLLPRIL